MLPKRLTAFVFVGFRYLRSNITQALLLTE